MVSESLQGEQYFLVGAFLRSLDKLIEQYYNQPQFYQQMYFSIPDSDFLNRLKKHKSNLREISNKKFVSRLHSNNSSLHCISNLNIIKNKLKKRLSEQTVIDKSVPTKQTANVKPQTILLCQKTILTGQDYFSMQISLILDEIVVSLQNFQNNRSFNLKIPKAKATQIVRLHCQNDIARLANLIKINQEGQPFLAVKTTAPTQIVNVEQKQRRLTMNRSNLQITVDKADVSPMGRLRQIYKQEKDKKSKSLLPPIKLNEMCNS